MKTLLRIVVLTAVLVAIPFKAVSAKTITIAVIDSGIDYRAPDLCKMGHKSFSEELPDPLKDENGHGTHVAGLVSKTTGAGDYCLVSIKYYNESVPGKVNLDNMIKAIKYAVNIKVDFINISGGGPSYDIYEATAIKDALNSGIKIVTAAGNDHEDLDKECGYFPACYDPRIIMVGNLYISKDNRWLINNPQWRKLAELAKMQLPTVQYEVGIAASSNYGKRVTRWQMGSDVESNLPNPPGVPGVRQGNRTGTSQAAAIATGWLVKQKLQK